MSKEIKLLEMAERCIRPPSSFCEKAHGFLTQALALLKQQPTAGQQLIIVRSRQIGKMTEWVKQLRPEVKIEESDCQKQRANLLAACEAWMKYKSESKAEHPCPDYALRFQYYNTAVKLTEAAIAKAKKEV